MDDVIAQLESEFDTFGMGLDHMGAAAQCGHCHGTGWAGPKGLPVPCGSCHGEGITPASRPVLK